MSITRSIPYGLLGEIVPGLIEKCDRVYQAILYMVAMHVELQGLKRRRPLDHKREP